MENVEFKVVPPLIFFCKDMGVCTHDHTYSPYHCNDLVPILGAGILIILLVAGNKSKRERHWNLRVKK